MNYEENRKKLLMTLGYSAIIGILAALVTIKLLKYL
jgi:hypothetical protein